MKIHQGSQARCGSLLICIANCNKIITDCDQVMKLNEKLGYLREVEGSLRGLGRALSQGELVRALRAELGESLSQSYLSQIESGARPHLTNTSRLMLARFFKVHPGYLVDDPEGYHVELLSEARLSEDKLDTWLLGGAERFRKDPELRSALMCLADQKNSRGCLLLLESLLEMPELASRLLDLLRPQNVPGNIAEPARPVSYLSTPRSAADLPSNGGPQ